MFSFVLFIVENSFRKWYRVYILFSFFLLFYFQTFSNLLRALNLQFYFLISFSEKNVRCRFFFSSFFHLLFFIFYEISENWKIAWVINYGNFCMKLEKIHFKIICSVIKKSFVSSFLFYLKVRIFL